MDNINQVAQPVNQPAAQPQEQVSQAPGAIPYSRFAEVVAQKNALQEQMNQVANQMVQSQGQQTPSSRPIESVDDLLAAVDRSVEKRLSDAYSSRLAPLEQSVKDYRFQNTLENYFASPEKSSLRQDMDAYTATLLPQEQQFLKDSIAQGRTQWLDNIYYSVASQKQNSLVNQATQQSQQNSGMAQSPQQFRTLGQVQPSMTDKIQTAKKDGNWNDVFASLVPK